MGGSRGTYGRQERCIQGLVVRLEKRRPLRRPRGKREDNIKMRLQKVGWGNMDWIDLAQDRGRWRALVYAVMSIRIL